MPSSPPPRKQKQQKKRRQEEAVVAAAVEDILIITDAQVLVVLALRERFTRPIARLLDRAEVARIRAMRVNNDDENGYEYASGMLAKGEEALRTAARLEAEYQWALGQAGLRTAVAAGMPRLATHCCPHHQPFDGIASSFAALATKTTTMARRKWRLRDDGDDAEAIRAAHQRCASTMELTSTTARIVAVVPDNKKKPHPYGARDGLTTPAGSWVLHCADL
jgi:hypothetical protein